MSKPLLLAALLLTLTLNMGCATSNQAPPGTIPPAAEAANPALAKLDKAIAEQQQSLDDLNTQIAEMEKDRDKARSTDPVHQEEVDRLENELEDLTEGQAHMEDALNTLKEQRAELAKSTKP